MANKTKKKNPLSSAKAKARKDHFESGGSLRNWSCKGDRHQDRKKAKNKKACRRKVSW